MRACQRLAAVLGVLLGCVGCDQTSKAIVRSSLERHAFFGGAFRLQRAENPGVFLSLGSTWPQTVRELVFTIGLGAVVAGLVLWAAFGRHLSTARRLCVAAIAAGGAGNLIDRISHDGAVTDFLYLGVGHIHTGIFNVADMSLMLGLVGLVLVPRTEGSS
jgi:signal peptidase II